MEMSSISCTGILMARIEQTKKTPSSHLSQLPKISNLDTKDGSLYMNGGGYLQASHTGLTFRRTHRPSDIMLLIEQSHWIVTISETPGSERRGAGARTA